METTIGSNMTVIMNSKFMPPEEFKHHCVAILQNAAHLFHCRNSPAPNCITVNLIKAKISHIIEEWIKHGGEFKLPNSHDPNLLELKDYMVKKLSNSCSRWSQTGYGFPILKLDAINHPEFLIEKEGDSPIINPHSPLWPPDIFKYTTESMSPCDLRNAYNKQRESPSDKRKWTPSNNHYVQDTFYSAIPESVHKIRASSECPRIDLSIDLLNGHHSNIHIRLTHPSKMKGVGKYHIAVADQLFKISGNARTHVNGACSASKMFAFGEKNPGIQYASNSSISNFSNLQNLVKEVEKVLENEFQATLSNVRGVEVAIAGTDTNQYLLGKYSRSCDISLNLSNPAHQDRGDRCKGVSMWLNKKNNTKNPSNSKNWWFVLPNLSINGSSGVAIELQHGLCIDWDGSIIKHCSATPSIENGDALLGVFLGGKNKFQSNSDRIDLPTCTCAEYYKY